MMFNEKEELYKENILDHYKHPHNFKELTTYTCSSKERNASCGDELQVFIELENGICSDVGFQGYGCAISQAAMSLLTDEIKGMTPDEIKELDQKSVLSLLGVQVVPARMKCALLSLKTIHKALDKKGE